MKPNYFRFLAAPLLIVTLPAPAVDLSEQLSIGGILAAGGQCQQVSARLPAEDDGAPLGLFDNECRGGMPLQFEISYRPNEAHEFFAKLGFATANGLNQVSPWSLAPWAADLEDDVKDINGRSRDYLLTAWYKHTLSFGDESALGASIGIIDATDYLSVSRSGRREKRASSRLWPVVRSGVRRGRGRLPAPFPAAG